MSDLQLLYPDNNVSSRPVVQFAAREPGINPISPGHAFVLVGIELDNGTTYFQSAGGFYPQGADSAMTALKNTLYGPGQVTYKLKDAGADLRVNFHVTQEQSDLAKRRIDGWQENKYSIWSQNCVSLASDVAGALGLELPPIDPTPYWDAPVPFFNWLRDKNKTDRPLEFDLEQKAKDAKAKNDAVERETRDAKEASDRAAAQAAAYAAAQVEAQLQQAAAERQRASEAQAAADALARQQAALDQQRILAEQAAANEAQRVAAEAQRQADQARMAELERAAREAAQRELERQQAEYAAQQQAAQQQAAELQRQAEERQRALDAARAAGAGGGGGYYVPPPPIIIP